MFFSKSCIYAVRASIYLAVNDDRDFIPIKEVANELNISFHFLTKILQTLTQTGIIKAVKGPKGGVTLEGSKSKISVYDVVEAIDGKEIFETCVLNLPGCRDEEPCSLHNIWAELRNNLEAEFKNSSLEKLANDIQTGNNRLFEVL